MSTNIKSLSFNESEGKLPLFVVAGMPRGGTTFLYHYLSKHPDVFLPFRKEVNFFATNYDRGLDWYHSLFKDMTDEKIAGDISPPCFLDENAAKRIKEYDSGVKVILVIREQAEWAVSFYRQFSTFEPSLPTLDEFIREGFTYKLGDKSINIKFTGNWLEERIAEYSSIFGDNLLLYKYEDFKKSPLSSLKKIESFLGIGNYFSEDNFDNLRINASNRRNFKLLSWVLSRQKFIEVLGKVIPSNVIVKLRSVFDKFSATKKQDNDETLEQQIQLARQIIDSVDKP